MFSDDDIKKAIEQRDLVIDPLVGNITSAGYDASVGDLAYIVQKNKRVDIKTAGKLSIPSRCTALIGTAESIKMSKDLIGFVVSKVSLCSKGLSHISTSLDPGWEGPLLVPVHNWDDRPITISHGETFCTLMFDKVHSTSKEPHNKPPYRTDITKYIDKIEQERAERRHKWEALVASPWVWILLIAISMGTTTFALNCFGTVDLGTAAGVGTGVGLVLATWFLAFKYRR